MTKEEVLEFYNYAMIGVAQKLQKTNDLVDKYLKLNKLEEGDLLALSLGLKDVGNSILELQHNFIKQGCFKDEN